MTLSLSPSEIRYSQDSISHKFSNGQRLTSTFARLISGQLSVLDLPALGCVLKDGDWYAVFGNRRLFLYKKLQEAGVLSTITVSKRNSTEDWNFTTSCDGAYINCRGSSLSNQIQKIISQWKRGQNVVAKWGNAPVSRPSRRSRRYDSVDFYGGLEYSHCLFDD